MARYKSYHNYHVSDSIYLIPDELIRDVFDGSEEGTRIRITTLSGQIDPYTEEITYFQSHTWFNVSGIIGQIKENDSILGAGRARPGDTVIVYPYAIVSGFCQGRDITAVEIATPNMSGIFMVTATQMDALADKPLFLSIALKLDLNG